MSELKVTSLEDLKNYGKGELVELPPFASNQPFVARLRRPSLMILMKSGKIPNRLLKTATALFNGDTDEEAENNENFVSDLLDVMDVISQASFVEPTFEEIRECGLELTDEQYMFVFNYSQKGVNALDPFREQSTDITNNQLINNV